MLFRQLFDQETWTYTYLLADEETREAVLIDPVFEQVDRDINLLEELGLKLVYTLDTHAHADHITGSGKLRERLGSKTALSENAGAECVDIPLSDGDTITVGRIKLEVRSTPGHTDGCLTFVHRQEGSTTAFTGDALLVRGCGRTDFQAGSPVKLYNSVHDKIFSLPADTTIYPGHDYKGHMSTTVEEEKKYNPRLGGDKTVEEFTEIMDNLNLPYPKKIDVAVPANLACGMVG